MRKIPVILLVCCFFQLNAQHTSRIDFNKNWQFKLDGNISWRVLTLPHDWSIEGKFDQNHPATTGGGALPGGTGWYRKMFTVSAADKNKNVFVDFDGVYCNSEVWINGHLLGKRPNGYISFQYDLTPYLHYGTDSNIITVKADNSMQPNSRWYSGSGIYRNVWLTVTDKVHIDQYGTFITTPRVSDNDATVKIVTKVQNRYYDEQAAILQTVLIDAAGREVGKTSSKMVIASAAKLVNSAAASVEQLFSISKPALWSTDKPQLYHAVTKLIINGKTVDTYHTVFGIRYFKFDTDKGFILNGKPLKILGVCDHHDLGALGAAVNTRALQRQLEILKEMGCNGIRTSHNPPAPELLDLCDRMGFIVMDEAFDMWAKQKNPYDYHLNWKEWHRKDLEDQILRDRNHPSVFIWSIGNEIPEQWGDAIKGDTSGRVIARELADIVKALDTTRPVTAANNDIGTKNNIILSGALDLIGYNYNHKAWKDFRKRWPNKPLIVTESTSALETRGYYDAVPMDTIRRWPSSWDKPFVNPNGSFTVSAYDHISAPWGSTHEESIRALKEDHVSGMYIWTGFDYLGEPTPYPWPARSSYFGIIDLAGFPKDVYYLYQSEFTSKPVLHIYPHWNWKQGDTIDVVAYYNQADEVALFLNGKSLGRQRKAAGDLHIKWRVPFTPGTLKAVSLKNGKTVLVKEVTTAATPARIVLKADRVTIKADGKDLSFITATIVDKNGITVPDAANLVKFTIAGEGSITGVDSGDPVTHEPFKSNQHTALNGLVLAIVRSSGKTGKIIITANAAGLSGTALTVDAK